MKPLDMLEKQSPPMASKGSSESEDAAGDILEAVASKDAKALNLALQRHYACCEGEESGEDDSDEEA